MSKSIKLRDNVYLSTKGIVHNRKVLADIIYPVGSIYISVNNTNPSTYYGGTWVQIKDRFLLACGNTYSNGATGGEATVKLDLPNYAYKVWNTDPEYANKDLGGLWQPSGNNYGYSSNYISNKNTPHNNMPPYLAVYVWKRTA